MANEEIKTNPETEKPKKDKKEIIRAAKFVLISCSAGLIEIGSFAVLNEFVWPNNYWPCYLIALTLSVLWNFTINRRFTFKSTANVPRAMALVFAYYCVFTPVSTVLGNYLADTLLWNEYIVTLLNMGLNLFTEYLWQSRVVFKGQMDNNAVAEKDAAKKAAKEAK